jgi:ABC-type Na+ efflux pump permease subunit
MIKSKKTKFIFISVFIAILIFYKLNMTGNIYLVNESKEILNTIVRIDNDTIYKNIVNKGVYEYLKINTKLNIGYYTIYVENLNNNVVQSKEFWVFTTTYLVVFFECNAQDCIYIEQQYSTFLPD